MLQAGDPAPAFILPDADMELFDSACLKGKHVVLYFYPRDDTPGCTREAIDFSDHEDEYLRRGCVVIGVSRDDCLSHADFRDKHGLSIPLLSDPDGEVCALYDVLQEKHRDGESECRVCVVRSTFIIDRKGIVRHAMYGVTPRGHAAVILGLVKQLSTGTENANCQEHHSHSELPGFRS